MRRYIGVFCLLLLIPLAALPASEGENIRVPQDYPSLNAAIAAAPPGSVITVAAGTYEENLIIDKDLTIVGEDRLAVVLSPPSDNTDEEEPLITVKDEAELSLSGVTLFGYKGFELFFISRAPVGIAVTAGSHLILESSFVFIFDTGVLIAETAEAEIRNTPFMLNGAGVQLEGSARAKITYDSFNYDDIGVVGGGEARLGLEGVVFQGSPLLLKDSAEATITATRFHGAGLEIHHEAHALMVESEIEGAESGIELHDQATLELNASHITECDEGISVWEEAKLLVKESEFLDNGTGIRIWGGLEGSPQLEVRANRIADNDLGIEFLVLSEYGAAIIEANEIVGNAGCGIGFGVVPKGFQVRGSGNLMRDNGMDLCGPFPAELRLPLVPQGEEAFLKVPDDYPTIQEAVDALAPGGTIELAPGEYHGGVLLWKPLTLRGAEGVILDNPSGVNPDSDRIPTPVIVVLPAAAVRLEGLEVRGIVGLQAWGTVHVTGCTFHSHLDGIEVVGGVARVEGSAFAEGQYGVWVAAGGELTVIGSDFMSYYVSIAIDDSKAELAGNTISGISSRAAVWLSGSSTASIHDNTITNCETGIALRQGAKAQIVDNEITAYEKGIYVERQSQATIEDNRLTDSRIGVLLYSGVATLRANEIMGCEEAGVLLEGRAQAEISGNRIVENEGWGIATWTKGCFPEDKHAQAKFLGEVTGRDNEIHDNARGDLCGVPAELQAPPPPSSPPPPPGYHKTLRGSE